MRRGTRVHPCSSCLSRSRSAIGTQDNGPSSAEAAAETTAVRRAARDHPAHLARHPAHPRRRLRGPRLRLRLRARAGQHLRGRRHLRDRRRRALALLRPRRAPTRAAATAATNNNLNSDFFYQRIIDNGTIEDAARRSTPPRGPRPEIKEGVRGYVAGYNRYLRETGVDNISDPACRGAPWVRPDHRDGRLPALLPARPARERRASRSTASGRRSRRRAPVPPPSRRGSRTQMLADLKQQLPLGGDRLATRSGSARTRPTTAAA